MDTPITANRFTMLRTRLLRRICWIVAIVFVAVLAPYGFSRIASPWRRVSVHSERDFPAHDGNDATLRIAGYNIAHGRALATSNREGGTRKEREMRLNDIADLLQELDADIVVLNEVDFDSSWSFSMNQAHYLAREAGYPYWVEQRNLDFRVLTWKWRFGNAVLSKYPIVEAGLVDLPGFSTAETLLAGKKSGIACTVDVSGEKVRIIGVHLSHRSEAVRAKSAELITEIASSGNVPTIVVGDLNSTPTGFPQSQSDEVAGNALDILDASALFQRSPGRPSSDPAEFTFHSAKPRSIIDWILVPKDLRILEYSVNQSTLSDHRPIMAELSLDRQ